MWNLELGYSDKYFSYGSHFPGKFNTDAYALPLSRSFLLFVIDQLTALQKDFHTDRKIS